MSDELDINPEGVDVPDSTLESNVDFSEQLKVDPSYEGILKDLPTAWHDKIIPKLQEHDRTFQSQIDQFSPFKEFSDAGIDPDVIRNSLQLADVALNDPVQLYRALAENLRSQGLLEEAAVADEQADIIEDDDDSDYELSPAIKREFERRDAILEEQQNYLNEVQFEAEVDFEIQQINAQMNDLHARYDITPQQEDAILRIMETQVERGEDATLYTAARELAEITGIRYIVKGDLPRADAPVVVGAAGGNSIPVDPLVIPKDDKGKREMLAEMFKQQLGTTPRNGY